MSEPLPRFVEALVAALLALSGLAVLLSAVGFVRAKSFFVRMHPPAVAYTLGSWTVVLANLLFFSVLEGRLVPHAGLILILLCITVPVTSLLLARVELFRQRVAGREDTPPPLVPSREHEAVPPPA